VKNADDLVLQAEEETVIHSITDRINEIGICYGMEMNVKKQI
jgi:ABC-type enterochelin transport system substrate-binding protein